MAPSSTPRVFQRPEALEKGCARLGLDPLDVQIRGGEDYELLFAVRNPRKTVRLSAEALTRRLGVPVTRIGEVVSRPGLHGLPQTPSRHHF